MTPYFMHKNWSSLCCYWMSVSLLLLVSLMCSFQLQARQALLPQLPQYQCQLNQADHLCQSFTESDIGLSLLASPQAVTGQPNGTLSLDLTRQTLRYKAGRIGGHLLLIETDALDNFDGDDFFYEALVRPFANSTTDRETLFLTMKVAGQDRYYAAGFKVSSSIYTSELELATLQGSEAQVLQSQSAPLVLGAQDDIDGQWYLLRVERRQGSLKLYLNSQLILTDNSIGKTAIAQLGLWSFNRSFELDYLRVGKSALTTPHINLQQLENQPLTGYQYEQSAQIKWQVTGADDSDIELVNLTPQRVALHQQPGKFTIDYLQPGSASVLLRSKSQPHIFKQLHISVLPALSFPAKTDQAVLSDIYPAVKTRVPADTLLRVNLKRPFNIGSSGAVRIYQVLADNSRVLVDEIRVKAESDAFGNVKANKLRSINRNMLWRDGTTLVIKPHSHALQSDKQYQVVIAADTVSFIDSNTQFAGVGIDANWSFSTTVEPVASPVMQVAADGTADFNTVQGALNFVMNAADGAVVETIGLAAGVYHEPLYLFATKNLTIEGAGAELSHIQFINYDSLNSGLGRGVDVVAGHTAGGRSLFLIEDVEQLTLKHLSFTNLHQRKEGVRNQAETVYFNSSGKLLVVNSHFISEQDTLMLKGTSYFYRCLIAGNVDFIWGQNNLSLFEQNEIRSVGNSVKNPDSEFVEGSYILQARTISDEAPGFIFINNRFTSYPGPTGNRILPGSTFLARSAGRPTYFDQVMLLNNQLGAHIAAQGWAGPADNEPVANPAAPDNGSGWREFGSTDLTGKLLDLSQRQYGIVLTAEQLPYQDSKAVLQHHWPDFNPEWLHSKL